MPNRLIVLREVWPDVSTLKTEAEILEIRAAIPRLPAGHPLQSYRHELSMRLRRIRSAAAGPLPDALVRSLIADAGFVCVECGTDMRFWVSKRWPSVDHIVPLSKGGSNDRSNLRVVCNVCNSRKGNRA